MDPKSFKSPQIIFLCGAVFLKKCGTFKIVFQKLHFQEIASSANKDYKKNYFVVLRLYYTMMQNLHKQVSFKVRTGKIRVQIQVLSYQFI